MSLEKPENEAPQTWVGDTTSAMRKRGGRDLEDYKEFLGFSEQELENKSVLDLGSGSREKLTTDLKKAGIVANVISINPDYTLQKYRTIINNQKDWQHKSVAGLAQNLPFADGSFDFILGVESITMYADPLHEPKIAKAWAKEIIRVLKPGGQARLGEILGFGGQANKEAWQEIIKLFEDSNLEAKIEPFKLRASGDMLRYRLIVNKPINK